MSQGKKRSSVLYAHAIKTADIDLNQILRQSILTFALYGQRCAMESFQINQSAPNHTNLQKKR